MERLSLSAKFAIFFRSWQLWLGELSPSENWSFPAHGRDLSKRTFLIRQIQPECFREIKKYCRSHKFTINDILTAAFYRSLYQLIHPKPGTPLRMGMTVNLRRYLPSKNGEAITNLAALFLLNIGTRLGDTLEETIQLVHERMNSHKRNFIGLELSRTSLFNAKWLPFSWGCWLNDRIFKLNRLLGPKEVPPWLTNMGGLNNDDFQFGGAKPTNIFLTAPVAFPPLFIIGISGFDDSITITVGFCTNSITSQKVGQLLASVEKELSQFG